MNSPRKTVLESTYLPEYVLDLLSSRSVAASYEFKIIMDVPKALT